MPFDNNTIYGFDLGSEANLPNTNKIPGRFRIAEDTGNIYLDMPNGSRTMLSRGGSVLHYYNHEALNALANKYYKISVKSKPSTMQRFTIQIYAGYIAQDIIIGGYYTSTKELVCASANLGTISSNDILIQVSFGKNEDGWWVAFPAYRNGDDLGYAGIDISNIIFGNEDGSNKLENLFNVELVNASEVSDVIERKTLYRPMRMGEGLTFRRNDNNNWNRLYTEIDDLYFKIDTDINNTSSQATYKLLHTGNAPCAIALGDFKLNYSFGTNDNIIAPRSKNNFIFGNKNKIKRFSETDHVDYVGNNIIFGTSNTIEQKKEKTSIANSFISGANNTIEAGQIKILGVNNVGKHVNANLFGRSLISSASNQTIIGIYNNTVSDTIFIVGNGYEDTTTKEQKRQNAFEIFSNGKVNIATNNLQVYSSAAETKFNLSRCGLQINNSDIVGLNGIWFNQNKENDIGEGLMFPQSNNLWLQLCMSKNGNLIIKPNIDVTDSNAKNIEYAIWHSGNLNVDNKIKYADDLENYYTKNYVDNNYYNKIDVDLAIDNKFIDFKSEYYDKTTINDFMGTIESEFNNYYSKTNIDNNFLKLTGGTLTGALITSKDKYGFDEQYNKKYSIHLMNSDIAGINCLWMNDQMEHYGEGIVFNHGSGLWDQFGAYQGELYFMPERQLTDISASGSLKSIDYSEGKQIYKIFHEGNWSAREIGTYNFIFGQNTKLPENFNNSSSSCLIFGGGNKITQNNNYIKIFGTNNESGFYNTNLFGTYLIAGTANQTIVGRYNIKNTSPFIIGAGSKDGRKNIFEINESGNIIMSGTSITMYGTDGAKYRIFININGQLQVTPI